MLQAKVAMRTRSWPAKILYRIRKWTSRRYGLSMEARRDDFAYVEDFARKQKEEFAWGRAKVLAAYVDCVDKEVIT